MTEIPERTTCCIAGGGPAGAMLGLLLARAGVDVTVLEKHDDFLRDFRGDTIHTSTIQVMKELGLAEAFHALPHEKVTQLAGVAGGERIAIADLSYLEGPYPYMMLMPQWDFLDFLADRVNGYTHGRVVMGAEVTGLLHEDGRVAGVTCMQGGEPHEIHADLTVACDGRGSTVRDALGLVPRAFGAPMDVLWFRLPRQPDDPETLAYLGAGLMLVFINRGDYFQTAYVIPKGAFEEVKSRGLGRFRDSIASLAPFMNADRVAEIVSWDQVKMLQVQIDRLDRWHVPGLLLIGDAAHAMSPVGGVGINLAIQDAVAAANVLAGPLANGTLRGRHLAAVRKRRHFPTAATQMLQRVIQRRVIGSVLEGGAAPRPPAWLQKVLGLGYVRRLTARLFALGIRPEHVFTPEDRPPETGLH